VQALKPLEAAALSPLSGGFSTYRSVRICPAASLVDRNAFELETIDVLRQRQFGDGQLILDRACLLLGNFGLEQIAGEALKLLLAFECRGEDLVLGVLHPKQFELAHQVQNFGSFHDHVLLSGSYRAQSASGARRNLCASGVRTVAAGPGSRWRARMLMITSEERTPSAIARRRLRPPASHPSARRREWPPSDDHRHRIRRVCVGPAPARPAIPSP
jgi:hypothetical protein